MTAILTGPLIVEEGGLLSPTTLCSYLVVCCSAYISIAACPCEQHELMNTTPYLNTWWFASIREKGERVSERKLHWLAESGHTIDTYRWHCLPHYLCKYAESFMNDIHACSAVKYHVRWNHYLHQCTNNNLFITVHHTYKLSEGLDIATQQNS